jgi:hypothetical protein
MVARGVVKTRTATTVRTRPAARDLAAFPSPQTITASSADELTAPGGN